MKVLMLTPSFYPIVGGTERVVQNLVIKLNEIGVETDVMTFNNLNGKYNPVWREEVKEDGFKLFRMPAINAFYRMKYNPLALLFSANFIPKMSFIRKLKDYDILHFHDDVDLTFPVFSSFIKKPRVFQCHTLAATYGFYKRNYFARKTLNKISHSYVCVSNAAKSLLSDLGVPKCKINVVYNGVDLEKFLPNNSERTENGLLYVGRIIRAKGLHVLLGALDYLDVPVRLKIVGPNQDCNYSEEIQASSGKQQRGIHEVEWLNGVDPNKIVAYYQEASVFVNPALKEEFGIVNLEAAACRTPIVASNIGGIKDFVKNDVNGVLVPPNNPEKLAEAIKRLMCDKNLRERYGENARRIVEEHFSWEQAAKKMKEVYEEVIKQ